MQRYLAYLFLTGAPLLWAISLWAALAGREPFGSWLYFFAWWPYIFFLEGWLYLREGEFWLLSRPRDFLRVCGWSVTCWLVFEVFNLFLLNWRYAGIAPQWWLRWPGYALSFATVLPGMLLTARMLRVLGTRREAQGRCRTLTSWQPLFLILGVLCLVLPFTLPRYCFALIWAALFFLLDPICDLLTGKSLTRGWLAGERREVYSLLAAGLICGLWWEAWNYPAAAKWVYTLPAFNFGKIFEMPVLGYLGFLPFALEGAVMYNFMQALEERVLTTPRLRRRFWLAQLAFWAVMFAALDARTVLSFR